MAPIFFKCTHCGKRLKAVPPSTAPFRVRCVQCKKAVQVTPGKSMASDHAAMAVSVRSAAAGDDDDPDAGDTDAYGDVFVDYKPGWHVEGTKPHPGDVVESQTLAAINVPRSSYVTAFELDDRLRPVITEGRLSALQLETVALCGARHLQRLRDGRRCGFFLGDGAGVGKGRQIAGLILDNWARNRRKHVWLSTSSDLRLDAERDLHDLGAVGILVHDGCQHLDREARGLGLSQSAQDGVVFSTYASLISGPRTKAGPASSSRLQQIVAWCGGAGFDGCLVFDECHKAKNCKVAAGTGYGGGDVEAADSSSKVAKATLELQQLLPHARVVYASATGISEPSNMAFMHRLGLWGPGTAFSGGFGPFLQSLEERGVGAMELLATDMKAGGMYVARALSFRAAEFITETIVLTEDQRRVYDGATAFWRRVEAEIGAANKRLAARGGAKAPAASLTASGVGSGGRAGHLRFFHQLCIASKVPQVVARVRQALAEGHCAVIGLQTTGEASLQAELSHDLALDRLPSQCRELLRRYIDGHFPTEVDAGKVSKRRTELKVAADEVTAAILKAPSPDEAAALRARHARILAELVATDDQLRLAAAGPCAECQVAKARLLQAAEALPLPPSALDWLIDELGGMERVAEMTGRRGGMRRCPRPDGGRGSGFKYALRTARSSASTPAATGGEDLHRLNVQERQAFMAGRKLVAIISDAASTGVSLHADERCANKRRRVHITLELPWSADRAIQQLGRSHRAGQTSAPLYILPQSDIGGEARFASAVARRLELMGALTRGDRRAASGADMSQFNLDTPYGKKAISEMVQAVSAGRFPDGVDARSIAESVGRSENKPAATESTLRVRLLHCLHHLALVQGGTAAMLELDVDVDEVAGDRKRANGTVKQFLNRMLECAHALPLPGPQGRG